jgi:O-antigen/teichoic acid export membrane protein
LNVAVPARRSTTAAAPPAAAATPAAPATPAGPPAPSAPARTRIDLRRLAAEQAGVATAQLVAGLGNAAFALIAARMLSPGGFAQVAAFLALYLLVHVPASSLSAGSALDRGMAARVRRHVRTGGLGLGAVVALLGIPLAPVLGLPVALALVLAIGVPAAMPLALERGRLFGAQQHGRAAGSLLVEPAVRLGLGVPLAAAAGATGAALGIVAGGWAALLVANGGPRVARRARPEPAAAGAAAAATGPAIVAFLGLALVQNQDVLLANALLSDTDAGRFAVLSTLGGIAAFATTTIPLVLLPRARTGERGALAAALGAAAALGLGAVAVVALAPRALVTLGFGHRFAGVAGLVAPYVGAMALLGIARVLVAQRCAQGAGRRLAASVGAVALLQAVAIVAFARTPGAVAACTFGAALLLVGASALNGGAVVLPFPGVRAPRPAAAATGPRVGAPAEPARDRRPLIALAGITAFALVLRLIATRGLWLDEATSVTQAQMPLHDLLQSLRTTDVHPPLHHVVLWATVHLFGTGQMVVRAPSILAGTLLIPVLWATGRELWGPRAGMAAAVLAAVAPFAVWYAQEARMYAFFMFFATVALYAQLRAMNTGRRRWWLAFALSGAALIWTQYFAAMVVGVLHAGTAWQLLQAHRRGEEIRTRLAGWLGCLALTGLLLIPLVHFAMDQFSANESAGRGFDQSPSQAGGDVEGGRHGPGVYSGLTNLVWAIWGYHSNATMAALTALWPALMLGALLLLGRGRPGRSGLVAAVAIIPALGMTVLGEAKPFLFEARYFIALTPMVLLLLARATTGWTASRTGAVLATGALALSLGAGTADQQLNRSNPRLYDFKGALSRIHDEAKPGDVVLYEPDYLGDLVRYLQPGVDARPLDKGIPKRDPAHRRQVFLLSSFLDQRQYAVGTAKGITAIQKGGRRQIDHFKKPQVKVWVFR